MNSRVFVRFEDFFEREKLLEVFGEKSGEEDAAVSHARRWLWIGTGLRVLDREM